MNQLIEKMFLSTFTDVQGHDSAIIDIPSDKLAITTDSFVVKPLFFPGGDIGSLAVHGTVNDLAMSGARPAFITASFIIEEGLAMEKLWQIVCSMAGAAKKSGVKIVAGDTKVIERSGGDGLYINTAGIGIIDKGRSEISPARIKEGDGIILSGDIGRHGMAVMTAREGLQFETSIESDSEDISVTVLEMIDAGIEIHCLRDATRGGVAAVLNEIALASGMSLDIYESEVTVNDNVRGACEILGIDPLHVANEGRFVAIVAADDLSNARKIIDSHNQDTKAAIIGEVNEKQEHNVTLFTAIGSKRTLDMPSGELLPRIC
jgi:hydrogenase expression/formation protein HypE